MNPTLDASLRKPAFEALASTVLLAMLAYFSAQSSARAIELISNGNFETGNFSGWTIPAFPGGFTNSGNWFVDTPGTTTPLSGNFTAGNGLGGSFYAVTDQTWASTHVLSQKFTVPGPASSVILSFQMFANDYDGGPIVDPIGLDHTGPANQHARVDILSAAAPAFGTGAGVLANYFLGVDSGTDPNPYKTYTFNITALVGSGGTYTLRFAQTDNQNYFNLGVDNVSINFTAVPEPSGLSLLLSGLVLIVSRKARLSRRINEREPTQRLGAR